MYYDSQTVAGMNRLADVQKKCDECERGRGVLDGAGFAAKGVRHV